MPRFQNSPVHSSQNLLYGDSGRSAQSDHRSSLGYSPSSQHLELSRVPQHTPVDFPSNLMAPMPPLDGGFQMFHPVDPMAANLQGYYSIPIPTYAAHPSRFPGHFPTANSGFVGNAYDQFMPAPQLLDDPGHFGQVIYVPPAAQQPPIPPAAPEEPTPPNPEFFHYPCRWLGGPRCNGSAPGRNREMGEHLRVQHYFIGHERDTVQCEWEDCGQIMQRMNVARHIVSRHLLAAARCRFCGKQFSRPDVVGRHERTCNVIPPPASRSTARI